MIYVVLDEILIYDIIYIAFNHTTHTYMSFTNVYVKQRAQRLFRN